MFPYRDENETQRSAIVTLTIVTLNVLAWLFVQGAGTSAALARSVCELGLIAGELTGSLAPGTRIPSKSGTGRETSPEDCMGLRSAGRSSPSPCLRGSRTRPKSASSR